MSFISILLISTLDFCIFLILVNFLEMDTNKMALVMVGTVLFISLLERDTFWMII
jgi:hypothetical protein